MKEDCFSPLCILYAIRMCTVNLITHTNYTAARTLSKYYYGCCAYAMVMCALGVERGACGGPNCSKGEGTHHRSFLSNKVAGGRTKIC